MNLNLKRVAELANQHDKDAAAIAQYGAAFASRTLSREEHAEIAEICRLYLSAEQQRNAQRADFARSMAAGIVAGMCSEPANVIDGPAIVYTAVDLADLLMAELAKKR